MRLAGGPPYTYHSIGRFPGLKEPPGNPDPDPGLDIEKDLSTRIKDAGIAIRRSRGYIISILQGPEMGWRDLNRCVHQS